MRWQIIKSLAQSLQWNRLCYYILADRFDSVRTYVIRKESSSEIVVWRQIRFHQSWRGFMSQCLSTVIYFDSGIGFLSKCPHIYMEEDVSPQKTKWRSKKKKGNELTFISRALYSMWVSWIYSELPRALLLLASFGHVCGENIDRSVECWQTFNKTERERGWIYFKGEGFSTVTQSLASSLAFLCIATRLDEFWMRFLFYSAWCCLTLGPSLQHAGLWWSLITAYIILRSINFSS